MMRVLLVDDEPFIMQGLSVLIDWKKEGYEIAGVCENGKEALDFLKSQQVDLIIADIQMPLMSGIELLKELRAEKISDAYFVILSGYSDFQYAREAMKYECMDYMLKPVQEEEVIKILRKTADLREKCMKQKIEHRQNRQAYLARNLIAVLKGKYDQINFSIVMENMRLSSRMRYVDIEIDEVNMLKRISDDEKRVMQRKIYQNCIEYLGEENCSYCIFDVSGVENRYDIGFLYCDYMAEEKNLSEHDYLMEMKGRICGSVKGPVSMFVGKKAEGLAQISESYRTASLLRSLQAFRQSTEISYFEEEMESDQKGSVLCKDSLDELVHAIEQNSPVEIEQKVEELYGKMVGLKVDTNLIKLNINYLLFQLIHLAVEQDDNVNQEEIMHFISSDSFECGTMGGSKKHLIQFGKEYGEYLAQLRKNMSGGVLCQVEKEVRERYAQNITLKELSKKYYINSAYLGQVFQKKHGQTFKEYLNNYRIEKAAGLLIKTDMKIYEIAEAVGYRDLDYFINRFILEKGCTPTKYRKQMRKS